MFGFGFGYGSDRYKPTSKGGSFPPPPIEETKITLDFTKPKNVLWTGII